MSVPDFSALIRDARATPFLGAAIVFFRKLRGMSQTALAKETDLSLSALKRLEAGRKRGGWPDTLETICRALNIEVQALFLKAKELAVTSALHRAFGK